MHPLFGRAFQKFGGTHGPLRVFGVFSPYLPLRSPFHWLRLGKCGGDFGGMAFFEGGFYGAEDVYDVGGVRSCDAVGAVVLDGVGYF